MNEPIISPWLIYFMSVSTQFKAAFIILSVASLFVFITLLIRFLNKYDDARYPEYYPPNKEGSQEAKNKAELAKKPIYIPIIFLTIFLLFAVLIPSRNTLIQMIVAKNITPNNISTVVKEGKELKENIKKDVLDIIMAIKDKDNGEPSR